VCLLDICFEKRIIDYSIFNVKHYKERKKPKIFCLYILGYRQHALITTVNLHFKKAIQLTDFNVFPAQNFI
jgi:hypothetical protein